MTTCPRRTLLSGLKSGHLIQVWLYHIFQINGRGGGGRGYLIKGYLIKGYLIKGYLIEQAIYLQIQSIVDIAIFFDTRNAIEKTTNLHNLFIWFILDHIHFFIDIIFIRGRNE